MKSVTSINLSNQADSTIIAAFNQSFSNETEDDIDKQRREVDEMMEKIFLVICNQSSMILLAKAYEEGMKNYEKSRE